jgi:trans-aconitate methyltransferase
MKLDLLRRNWDMLAQIDAPYFILSKPGKRGNWDLREFFETGIREVAELMAYVDARFPDLRRGLALDFGCGIGRLTQALCAHFGEAHGVDISQSMVNKAELYGVGTKCRFFRLDTLDLLNHRYDLIYSNIVLQHVEPEHSLEYIRQFFERLAYGGVLVFQLPYASRSKTEYPPVNEHNFSPRMEMYAIPKGKVLALVPKDVEVVDILDDSSAGPDFDSHRYVFRKRRRADG